MKEAAYIYICMWDVCFQQNRDQTKPIYSFSVPQVVGFIIMHETTSRQSGTLLCAHTSTFLYSFVKHTSTFSPWFCIVRTAHIHDDYTIQHRHSAHFISIFRNAIHIIKYRTEYIIKLVVRVPSGTLKNEDFIMPTMSRKNEDRAHGVARRLA